MNITALSVITLASLSFKDHADTRHPRIRKTEPATERGITAQNILNGGPGVVQQRIADPFHPHPVVKATMIAVEASRGGKDGNYVGVSGDADLHGGVPHLSHAAAIKKKGDSYDILEVDGCDQRHYGKFRLHSEDD
jgi:hypothetical protein